MPNMCWMHADPGKGKNPPIQFEERCLNMAGWIEASVGKGRAPFVSPPLKKKRGADFVEEGGNETIMEREGVSGGGAVSVVPSPGRPHGV